MAVSEGSVGRPCRDGVVGSRNKPVDVAVVGKQAIVVSSTGLETSELLGNELDHVA